MPDIVTYGNCQAEGMARCAAAALGMDALFLHPSKVFHDPELLADALRGAKLVFATRELNLPQAVDCAAAVGRSDLPILPCPSIYYSGFHPDVVFPSSAEGDRQDLPMVNANSAILLAAWREGLSAAEAIGLFRDEVYEALGYYDFFGMANDALIEECALDGIDVEPKLGSWLEDGPFVYVPNHPTIQVLCDLAMMQLRRHELHDGVFPAGTVVEDRLAKSLVWPVYPEIAEKLGVPGNYIFQPKRRPKKTAADAAPMDLPDFVERTFARYAWAAPDLSLFVRLTDPRLDRLRRFVKDRPASSKPANPYRHLDVTHWWSKAVAGCRPKKVDPVVRAKFAIGKADKVATAGSCFAQHLAKRLEASGFNYFVTEQAPAGCDPAANDYGVFSARFGNIYTVRQLLQLAGRVYGSFQPATDAWEVPGGFADPFRPRIGGTPFATLDDLQESRETHFDAVRAMFEEADVFVFTLGLTEAWIAASDGAIVPLAPGVVAADTGGETYVAKNFTVTETLSDLKALVDLFQQRNPSARIILTVSPVPLIATYQDKHVLEATTHSKAVLRAAAGEIADQFAHVAYFPSFEIVTGSFNRGRYFADDLRQVTDNGVDHVMRVFLRHYGGKSKGAGKVVRTAETRRFRAETRTGQEILCDEEEIEASAASGS